MPSTPRHPCLTVYGGAGFNEEYPVAKLYRDARIFARQSPSPSPLSLSFSLNRARLTQTILHTVYEGTTEIQKLVISRTVAKEFAP